MFKKRWIKSVAILAIFVANLGILAKDGFHALPALAVALSGIVLVWDVVDAAKENRKADKP
ncbi:hypothetical protein LJC60_04895 [Ruminococcaceae bacterium OttesenSCG-928-D13]|nr:hypothetical protein [Ruminococcaceae bacterium OttesenSCG-928-D13]